MPEGDTRLLFEAVQRGDEEACREVFDRYLHRLVALARSRLSEKLQGKFDAHDVVQSAFVSFFVRAREGQYAVERAGDLWSLLASITRHKLLKKAEHFRQQKRELARDRPLTPAVVSEAIHQGLVIEPVEMEAIALSDEVEFLTRNLDPLQRTMIELRLQGESIAQIADSVERSERTVRRFLGRFREDLERRLNELRGEEPPPPAARAPSGG